MRRASGRIMGRSVYVLSLFSCILLLANPMYYSPLGSSLHGILQARIKKKKEKKYTVRRGRLTSVDLVLM